MTDEVNLIVHQNNRYIESKYIKVFPCAYRGYYKKEAGDEVTTIAFDPESRSTTEANFTNTFHSLSKNKESYVVGWDDDNNILKCVIGGYYFEISNYPIDTFFYEDGTLPYYLCIKTELAELASSDVDTERTSPILSSFAETTNYLDILVDSAIDKYAFTGLTLKTAAELTASTSSTSNLAPFKAEVSYTEDIIATDINKADQIGMYYWNTNSNSYIKINTETEAAMNGSQLYHREVAYKVNPVMLPITSMLDVGTGNYSLRMLGEYTGQGTNNTVASGDYSVALGKSTKATGESSTALGSNTEASGEGAFTAGIRAKASNKGAVAMGQNSVASGISAAAIGQNSNASGDYSFAVGNNTNAANRGAVALGSNTTANANNQVVIGQYNTQDSNQAFIIANGTAGTASNKFTVGYEGNVKALGNLEVKGFIKATGNTTNELELGTSAANSTGSIKVYGESASETPIFKVENTGNTTIAGITHITNITDSELKTSGALVVAGGVGIGNKLNVGGNVTITGTTTLNNNLVVASDKTTLLGGSLTVNKSTLLKDTLVVEEDKKTTLGGELEVSGNTKINEALEVATGKTTTLGGTVNITDTTDADEATAALTIAGGTKIAKKLIVGSDTTIAGSLTSRNTSINGNINTTGTATIGSSLTATNGTASFGATNISGNTNITSTTTATAKDTGALKVAGGVGIGENLYVGGLANVTGNTSLNGTVNISGATTINNKVSITNDTNANSSDGALKVAGGVNISKNLYVGTNIVLSNNNNTLNTFTIGNESTNNGGGQLKIYGTGNSTVFEVDNKGNIDSTGYLDIDGTLRTREEATIGKSLTVDGQVQISKEGIEGIRCLVVNGKIEGSYFNATMYSTSSDARLKNNIEDYKFNKSILDLPIKRFEYNNDETHTKHIGCLAQDLQEICPELVVENKDGMLSIQENKLIYALLQEVKELKEKVELLERK